MTDKIRWGIIGTGNIASQFARGLAATDEAELVAVGSRSQQSADKFGDEFNVKRRYATYEALAADSDVQAVYIATPHPYHHDNTVLCLENGKAVLCEKPFAMNAAEAANMIRVAREKKVFLMEAMWTRFLPAIVKLREMLTEGMIGDVRLLQADFGFRTGFNPKGRLFDPALGGGAQLDVGIYPMSFASMIFGQQPSKIMSFARLGETGVDEEAALLFGYPGGQMAQLFSATRLNTQHEATLIGTEGRIRVHRFWVGKSMTLTKSGQDDQTIEVPFKGNGYTHEAEEVGRCLRAGLTESATMPLDETLAIMQTMDAVLAQWHG